MRHGRTFSFFIRSFSFFGYSEIILKNFLHLVRSISVKFTNILLIPRYMKYSFCLLICLLSIIAKSQTDSSRRPMPPPVGTITPTRQTPVHDPVMIKQKDTYYLFCTGNGISVFSSRDMQNWRKEKPV